LSFSLKKLRGKKADHTPELLVLNRATRGKKEGPPSAPVFNREGGLVAERKIRKGAKGKTKPNIGEAQKQRAMCRASNERRQRKKAQF